MQKTPPRDGVFVNLAAELAAFGQAELTTFGEAELINTAHWSAAL